MGQYKFSCWLMVAVPLFLIYSSAIADDEETDRLTLKGLKGIYVKVLLKSNENEFEDLKNKGLNEETIKTDIELKSRMAGVKVVSRDDMNKIPGRPMLVVSLAGMIVATRKDTGNKHIAFGITISLFQDVFLSRNMEYYPSATTWSETLIGHKSTEGEKVNFIRGAIKDSIDKFINAYLSVNPKEKK